tara:strand:- start:2524 stop:2673 length:150 start_codon:yes stop_codon:yes gene_type:complete
MAKRTAYGLTQTKKIKVTPKRTSIGKSKYTKPKNKHKRKCWKKYRGQGK